MKLKKDQLDRLEGQVDELISELLNEFDLSHDEAIKADREIRRQLAIRLVP